MNLVFCLPVLMAVVTSANSAEELDQTRHTETPSKTTADTPANTVEKPKGIYALYNLTTLKRQLKNFTEAERKSLFASVGVKNEDELFSTLGLSQRPSGGGFRDYDEVGLFDLNSAKMHVRSYEQDLMQYTEYRVHKMLLLYVPPLLIAIGTFGNIFSFVILRR